MHQSECSLLKDKKLEPSGFAFVPIEFAPDISIEFIMSTQPYAHCPKPKEPTRLNKPKASVGQNFRTYSIKKANRK